MENISVVGAGLMGHGIASVFALGGYKVTLHDVSEDALTRAQKLISEVFHTLAEAGVIDLQGSTPTLKDRIICTTNLATAAAQADLIVEAVTEDVTALAQDRNETSGCRERNRMLSKASGGPYGIDKHAQAADLPTVSIPSTYQNKRSAA